MREYGRVFCDCLLPRVPCPPTFGGSDAVCTDSAVTRPTLALRPLPKTYTLPATKNLMEIDVLLSPQSHDKHLSGSPPRSYGPNFIKRAPSRPAASKATDAWLGTEHDIARSTTCHSLLNNAPDCASCSQILERGESAAASLHGVHEKFFRASDPGSASGRLVCRHTLVRSLLPLCRAGR
jgi:hypothetical protein